jgi:hypothetical protein
MKIGQVRFSVSLFISWLVMPAAIFNSSSVLAGNCSIVQDQSVFRSDCPTTSHCQMFGLEQDAAHSAFCESDSCAVDRQRLASADKLIRQARVVRQMNDVLMRWADCLALEPHDKTVLRAEAAETDREVKAKSDNFEKLYAAYQEARTTYFLHKQEYDKHVAQFHNQPPQMISGAAISSNANTNSSSNLLPPVPPYQPLKLKVGAACRALQGEERMLSASEAELAACINELISSKGKANSALYAQQWQRAEQMATALQSRVLGFGQQVLQKEQLSQEELHNLTQAALRDGDAVESRRVFLDAQHQTQVDNQEIARAHLHSNLFANLSSQLGRLNPALSAVAITTALAPARTFITFDQIQGESQALQSEYEQLQERYAELQQAIPPNAKSEFNQ